MKTRLAWYVAIAAISTVAPASAATVTSLVGDIDGFGGQTAPGAIGAETGFGFDNTGAGDPTFTDAWIFATSDGPGGSPVTYEHTYELGSNTATMATLSIMESGMSDDGRDPWQVMFNGSSLGQITNEQPTSSKLHEFVVDTSWLTGSDTVSLVYQDTLVEGYAIDYSELSITTIAAVPLPAGGLLLLGGLGALVTLRRRKS